MISAHLAVGHFPMGVWIIFPIVMLVFMFIFMSRMFSQGRIGPRTHDSSRHSGEVTRSETPLDILERRYARGETTREEFDHMKQDLRG